MIACKHVMMQAIENCISAAGYDVGEYAALVFAGAMSFEDGAYAFSTFDCPLWDPYINLYCICRD